MRRRRERGAVLLAAVAALATLTVLAVGLAATSAVDQHLTRNALAALQADALVRSGVAVAAVLLREHAATETVDTLAAPWARASGRQPLGAGWVEVRVEDEARRLDLTAPALAEALPRLLAVLGLDPRLADAVADWTDADDEPRAAGAERDFYLGLVPPYRPANARLASVGELRLVRGVDAAALARLRPHVTAAGEAAVNPNTATPAVLRALAGDDVAARLVAARAARPIAPATDLARLLPGRTPEEVAALGRRLTPRGRHYRVLALGVAGEARRAAEATLAVDAGTDARVVGWRPLADADAAL